ncbi:hypothetical protein ACWCYK_31530 [Streptomyces lydicamycinicus]
MDEVATRLEGRLSPAVLTLVKAQVVQADLFGEPGKHVIDFDLIESQFRHLMRVAVSVREARSPPPHCSSACARGRGRTPPTPPSARLAA